MARPIHRLSARKVQNALIGMHADGGGLYLQVTSGPNDAIRRSWIYRYASNGGERHMGLGSLADVGLAQARQKAADARRLRLDGLDPLDARKASKAAAAKAKATAMTFDACRDAYIAAHRSGWRNAKHLQQWQNSLRDHVSPILGNVFVHDIDTALVMQVLEPIWTKRPETAARVRGRIECILDWAKVRGHREGENPARWRGHLDHLLPPRRKVQSIRHHPALSYRQLPAFIRELRKQDGIAARALEFTILTAARANETVGATVNEIDTGERIWTVPADRMKGHREHRVPLCKRALAIVAELEPVRDDGQYVFTGERSNRAIVGTGMLAVLARMGRTDITVHGFRSTFRDWAAEQTNFQNEVVEVALAHTVGSRVEAAYRRGDLFEKRRRLMNAWAEFCERGKATGDVIPLARR